MKQMTTQNMIDAFAGETYEIEEMYPAFMTVAKFQGEESAYRSFDWSYQTEKMHKALFKKAETAVSQNRDVELDAVQVCMVCGYTLEGDAPSACPVCKAAREKFTSFIAPS